MTEFSSKIGLKWPFLTVFPLWRHALTSQVKKIFIFEISEIIAFHWCIIRPCLVKFIFLPSFWWLDYDVTEHFDEVGDVVNRNIVEIWEDMESLRKFYGAVFEKPESLPYWSLFWVTENTRPVSKMEYTHAPEKKVQNLFFFRISFHSIQEKKDFSYKT